MTELPSTAQVVIVGAGPAGLAAAAALAGRGIAVHVLDREAETGGIPRHCAHSPYGWREFRRAMRGPAYARALTAAARSAGARLHPGVTVTALHPGGRVAVTGADGPGEIAAGLVLVATGARESSRAARLIGGTRPGGVLNTGALQGLVHLEGLRPFRHPVVAGTELVSFSALLTCQSAGIRPRAMIEPGPRITARHPAGLLPRLLGVPLHLGTRLTAIHGRDRVEAVTVETGGRARQIATDGVILTGGFRPEAALIRASHLAFDPRTGGPEVDQYGRCSDPSYFAAGNLLRAVETAPWCWAEGRAVAGAMAAALDGTLPGPEAEPVRLEAPGLAWHLPQRLAAAGAAPALDRLQMRAARALDTTLRAPGGSWRLVTRPERRATLPLPAPGETLSADP